LTFAELKTELSGRGYDVLGDGTRDGRYINQAYQFICRDSDWPFLLTTATAQTPPTTISDLGPIESVFDATSKGAVKPIDRRTLREMQSDLTTTGTPTYYYMAGQTTVTTFPVGGSLTITYWKIPTTLSNSSDTPVIPTNWQLLIVDLASIYAMKDAGSWEDIPAAQQVFNNDLQAMRHALLKTQHDEPEFIVSHRGHEGY
jgi:hypothetical protein